MRSDGSGVKIEKLRLGSKIRRPSIGSTSRGDIESERTIDRPHPLHDAGQIVQTQSEESSDERSMRSMITAPGSVTDGVWQASHQKDETQIKLRQLTDMLQQGDITQEVFNRKVRELVSDVQPTRTVIPTASLKGTESPSIRSELRTEPDTVTQQVTLQVPHNGKHSRKPQLF